MFESGRLRVLAKMAVDKALASGSLLTLETHSEIIADHGIAFLVRILSSRLRKEQHAVFETNQGVRSNAFLPYDPNLFVADFSKTHVCLINKYNVLSFHLLMVTREYVPQEEPLTIEDFETIVLCLREFEGLAFYNSDQTAGASQPHKHLQYVPLDADPLFLRLPIQEVLSKGPVEVPLVVDRLPFEHAVINWDGLVLNNPEESPERLWLGYQKLKGHLSAQSRSHNLLVTRNWAMLVPRSRESYRSISVNSLGYAGSLLVKNQEEMEWIRQAGPMSLLQHCGFPRSGWRLD